MSGEHSVLPCLQIPPDLLLPSTEITNYAISVEVWGAASKLRPRPSPRLSLAPTSKPRPKRGPTPPSPAPALALPQAQVWPRLPSSQAPWLSSFPVGPAHSGPSLTSPQLHTRVPRPLVQGFPSDPLASLASGSFGNSRRNPSGEEKGAPPGGEMKRSPWTSWGLYLSVLGKGCLWCAPGPTAAQGRQNSPPRVQIQNQALPVTFLPILGVPIPTPSREIGGGLCPSRDQDHVSLGLGPGRVWGVTHLSVGPLSCKGPRRKGHEQSAQLLPRLPLPHPIPWPGPRPTALSAGDLSWTPGCNRRSPLPIPGMLLTTPLWPLSSPPSSRAHSLPWTPSLLSS